MQKYFWACVLNDDSQFCEFNADGTENYFPTIPDEIKNNTKRFGLVSANDSYFFDLENGEYHFKNDVTEEVKQICIPFGPTDKPLEITGKFNGINRTFYQFKQGHTDFDITLKSAGNIIDKHMIGYTFNKLVDGKNYFIDVKLTIDPNIRQIKPILEITLKSLESGETVATHTLSV